MNIIELRPQFWIRRTSLLLPLAAIALHSCALMVLAEDRPMPPQSTVETVQSQDRGTDPDRPEKSDIRGKYTPEGVRKLDIEQNSRVIRHETRGGVPLEKSSESRSFEGQAPTLWQNYDMSLDGKLSFPSMPACRKSEVERREVFHYSLYSDLVDLIVFDASNQSDFVRAAKGISIAVPWVANTPLATDDPRYTPWLRFAASMDLKCLPARIHLVTEDANRFIEVRRGAEAWVETEQDKIDKKRFASEAEKLKASGK